MELVQNTLLLHQVALNSLVREALFFSQQLEKDFRIILCLAMPAKMVSVYARKQNLGDIDYLSLEDKLENTSLLNLREFS